MRRYYVKQPEDESTHTLEKEGVETYTVFLGNDPSLAWGATVVGVFFKLETAEKVARLLNLSEVA